jgi:hypothetical protein
MTLGVIAAGVIAGSAAVAQTTPQSLPTVPRARDVVGIALGMTRDEARAALFRHDPNLAIRDLTDAGGQPQGLAASIPETAPADTPRDRIVVRLGGRDRRVIAVGRDVSFVRALNVSFTGTYESIERKYGPRSNPVPLDQVRRSGLADLVWIASGTSTLERNEARIEACKQAGPLLVAEDLSLPAPRGIDATCGVGLHIRMTSHTGNTNVVANLTQRLWDASAQP